MKKIKLLFLALLGISIIPTATNAYDIVNKFNGNYGLLYKEYRGSILYRCPYTSNIDLSSNPSWQATSSSFPCIPGQEFSNSYFDGQFTIFPMVDINKDIAQYITAIKKKNGKYLPIGIGLQRKFGKFQVEHKNGIVNYDKVRYDPGYQYGLNLKSEDGRYGQLLGGLFLDGLFIKSFSRESSISRDYGYRNLVVVDTDTRMGYLFETNISITELLDTSFISLIYSLSNSTPKGCRQLSSHIWEYAVHQYSFEQTCPEFNIKQKLEKSLTISQGIRKLFKEESPYYDPNFKVNKILGEVPETTAPSVNSAESYNQCSSYWSDVKNLAYYSQRCGDDPADEQTQNRVKVDSWNAEGNLPEFSEGANKNKCGRFANAKKKYKEKYKENWEKFYADFSTYARTPESVNVEVQCKGVELEHGAPDWFKNNDNVKQRQEVLSGMIKGNKSMAEALQDDRRIVIKGTGENAITRGDYLDDTRYLRDLLSQCRGLKFRGLYTGELVQDSQYYCSLYEIQKQTLIAKYAGVDFQSHNLTSLEKFITRIENIANQGLVSHSVDELKKMGTNILSDLGNQLYSYVQDPYMSGFHQVSFIQCNNSFRVEAFDIIMYILFAAFIFLLFKYL